MNNEYAPVGLSVYKRLGHVQKTINALQCNDAADRTSLYVFSDGAGAGDEAEVAAVREYLHQPLEGFASVSIIERESNLYITNNRLGHKLLLDRYGKMIWLEEDVVTAPGFLTFMNAALNAYKDNPRVLSICGYAPPLQYPEDFTADCFAMPRFCAWGIGIWKEQYEKVTQPQMGDLAFAQRRFLSYSRNIGWDGLDMLRQDALGQIDAWDVKAMYHNWRKDRLTVYPRHSLTQNIGHDGSGVHCGTTARFDVELSTQRHFSFPADIEVDQRVLLANAKFRDIRFKRKARFLSKLIRSRLRALFSRLN